jgi:transcription elongation factor Elf1
MAGHLDGAEIGIPCPGCGHNTKKSIGWLKTQNQLTCGGCGKVIELESSNFRQGMREVDASIKKLTDTFKKFGR